jgi:hypothetical protein
MIDRTGSVKKALRPLEAVEFPERDETNEAERRARILAALDARMSTLSVSKRRGERRQRASWIAAAAALLVVAGAGAFEYRSHAARERAAADVAVGIFSLVREGENVAVDSHDALDLVPEDRLETPSDGRARAVLTSGAVVDVQASTTVRFARERNATQTGEELVLSHGSVALKVPKLGALRTLAVVTPDARVTVHGTAFRVDIDEAGARPTTSVTVTEGTVWVTQGGRDIVLPRGSHWSSAVSTPDAHTDATPLVPTMPATPPRVPPPNETTPAPSPGVTARSASSAFPSSSGASNSTAPSSRASAARIHDEATSTLGVENDEYHQAVSAVRSGNDASAVSQFDAFLARFPSSPLAQNAEVERFRALHRLGRTAEAARRARSYLVSYPRGFAHDEAQALAVDALRPSSGP